MSRNLSKEKRGASPDPTESGDGQKSPKVEEQKETLREGSFRNVETSVNKAEDFDDSYEIEREDELTEEEGKTEHDGRTGKS